MGTSIAGLQAPPQGAQAIGSGHDALVDPKSSADGPYGCDQRLPGTHKTLIATRSKRFDFVIDVTPTIEGYGEPCAKCGDPMYSVLTKTGIDFTPDGRLYATKPTHDAFCRFSYEHKVAAVKLSQGAN